MLAKYCKVFVLLSLALCAFFTLTNCGPLPIVNEQQVLMPKVPQWHCLRYFKHDLLMMRRCRHLRVPTAPRMAENHQK